MEPIIEIEQDLNIDKDNLDFECIDQPKRFMKWAAKFAEAIKQRDQAKREISVIRSNINQDIRNRPDAYSIPKVTESAISSTLESVEDVVNAENTLIETQFTVNIFGAAKEAFDQRKSMLERLTQLYLSGYYSQPKQDNEAMNKMSEVGTENQKSLLRKTIKQ